MSAIKDTIDELKKIKQELHSLGYLVNSKIEEEQSKCTHENATKTDWHDSQILFKCPECGKRWYEYSDWYKEHHKKG